MKAFKMGKHAVVTHANAGPLNRWRTDIKNEAQRHLASISNEAIVVYCVFMLRKAKSRKKTDLLPMNEGSKDGDKLLRSVLDALHEVVYPTDAAVVDAHVKKRWALPDQQAGVHVWICELIPVAQ